MYLVTEMCRSNGLSQALYGQLLPTMGLRERRIQRWISLSGKAVRDSVAVPSVVLGATTRKENPAAFKVHCTQRLSTITGTC